VGLLAIHFDEWGSRGGGSVVSTPLHRVHTGYDRTQNQGIQILKRVFMHRGNSPPNP